MILQDHLHCIWTVPPDDSNFSRRRQLIEADSSVDCQYSLANTLRLQKPNSAFLVTAVLGAWRFGISRDFTSHVNYINPASAPTTIMSGALDLLVDLAADLDGNISSMKEWLRPAAV
ncbi:MAG: hypothetical protein U1D69_14255 [Polynucleobacter sp.]|nr:hypothetical protein [Polynucleobacter sp.]